MTGNRIITTRPSDTEIVMSRVFDAPRDLVFEAHTFCEHFVHWWGPQKYDVDCDIDFRVGGTWRIVIRSQDNEVTFFGDYLEIEAPERFVWTFGFNDNPGGPETYTFEEHDGKTTITSRAVFPSKEMLDEMMTTGMEDGANELYDRLDEYLEVLKNRVDH
ncbi:MAG: SRPBCC family protein [Actinomycetota bacterium]